MILFAEVFAGWSIIQILTAVIVIAAVAAIVSVAVRAMGVAIPDWVVKILWIVAIAFVALIAIRIVLSL